MKEFIEGLEFHFHLIYIIGSKWLARYTISYYSL